VFPQASDQGVLPTGRGATAVPLPNRWCRPVLTTVAGRHLSKQQDLPDRADAITSLAPIEVLAVDAARGG
jgi:hypothetical protein